RRVYESQLNGLLAPARRVRARQDQPAHGRSRSAPPLACDEDDRHGTGEHSRGLEMSMVRTNEPVRQQGIFRWEMPEDALPDGHTARLLWRVVETLDLSAFTSEAKAVEGHAGRNATSVRMLLTLWLYAISIGIGSAREIARRTQSDA